MTLVRWEPFRELTSLQHEMNRLFNSVFDSPTTGVGSNGQGGMRRWAPAMDLLETEDHFVLRADLPGIGEDQVKIEVEDNVLTLSGERVAEHETKQEGYYRVERSFGSFARSVTLPKGVAADSITATFGRGVLEVRIPKPAEAKPRRVAIEVGGRKDQPAIEGSESA